MPNPTIRIHNLETDQVTDRPMTDKEYAEHVASCEASLAEIEALKG
jgi:hypothetical protein